MIGSFGTQVMGGWVDNVSNACAPFKKLLAAHTPQDRNKY